MISTEFSQVANNAEFCNLTPAAKTKIKLLQFGEVVLQNSFTPNQRHKHSITQLLQNTDISSLKFHKHSITQLLQNTDTALCLKFHFGGGQGSESSACADWNMKPPPSYLILVIVLSFNKQYNASKNRTVMCFPFLIVFSRQSSFIS